MKMRRRIKDRELPKESRGGGGGRGGGRRIGERRKNCVFQKVGLLCRRGGLIRIQEMRKRRGMKMRSRRRIKKKGNGSGGGLILIRGEEQIEKGLRRRGWIRRRREEEKNSPSYMYSTRQAYVQAGLPGVHYFSGQSAILASLSTIRYWKIVDTFLKIFSQWVNSTFLNSY